MMTSGLKLDKAILVGHSIGSVVARGMALAAPSRIEKLVLIGTPKPLRIAFAGFVPPPGPTLAGEGPLDPRLWHWPPISIPSSGPANHP